MNDQWFSGDPSTAIRKARIFGRDDRVRVESGGGQYATFFQTQTVMPAASSPLSCHPDQESVANAWRDLIDKGDNVRATAYESPYVLERFRRCVHTIAFIGKHLY